MYPAYRRGTGPVPVVVKPSLMYNQHLAVLRRIQQLLLHWTPVRCPVHAPLALPCSTRAHPWLMAPLWRGHVARPDARETRATRPCCVAELHCDSREMDESELGVEGQKGNWVHLCSTYISKSKGAIILSFNRWRAHLARAFLSSA